MKLPMTTAELLEFCNSVRQAGGAETIDKLQPGLPRDMHSCLIAKNLNFESRVAPKQFGEPHGPWVMMSEDPRLAQVAEAMDLPCVYVYDWRGASLQKVYQMDLPTEVGQMANAFDTYLLPDTLYVNGRSVRFKP